MHDHLLVSRRPAIADAICGAITGLGLVVAVFILLFVHVV